MNKMNKPRLLNGEGQSRMIRNGWRIELAEFRETPEMTYERLIQRYSQVKIYYRSTRIRGYYHTFAMVK